MALLLGTGGNIQGIPGIREQARSAANSRGDSARLSLAGGNVAAGSRGIPREEYLVNKSDNNCGGEVR